MTHRPLRIGVDACAAAETGAGRGRYVRELLRHLAGLDAEHEFRLYARRPWEVPELDGRFSWHTISAPHLLWPLLAVRPMSRDCDVALATGSYLLAGLMRRPCVAIVYDFVPFHAELGAPRGSAFERLTLPLAVRRSPALVAISHATKAELVRRFPGAAGKTRVVHPGADAAFSQDGREPGPVVRAHGIERPYVLVTATLEPRKNLARLIDAFAGLPPDLTRSHELVLVGARGWRSNDVRERIAEHPDCVRALGYVADDDLPALYRGATVFCYPSLQEGFGLPVLEALQCGTPVIASRLSSLPEVAGDAARYIDPHAVEDIRDALLQLLRDPSLRRELGARGPAQAAKFSWARSAAALLEILEAAGSEDAGGRRRSGA